MYIQGKEGNFLTHNIDSHVVWHQIFIKSHIVHIQGVHTKLKTIKLLQNQIQIRIYIMLDLESLYFSYNDVKQMRQIYIYKV